MPLFPSADALTSRRAGYAPLRWRESRYLSQLLALVLTTLMAPTLLVTGVLLALDTRSDHPAFWVGLIAIVPLGNLLAAGVVRKMHDRQAFGNRWQVCAVYLTVSLFAGSIGFTWLGWDTGFLADVLAPARTGAGLFDPLVVLASLGMSTAYSALSFAHAGLLHAWLAFSAGTAESQEVS